MAGVKGRSGPPGNQNNFKHGLAAIQKRREERITTEHEESVRQQILDSSMIVLNAATIKSHRINSSEKSVQSWPIQTCW